ncbi:MAG: sulfotransferase family protein, partial [Bacteroidota bacterium]
MITIVSGLPRSGTSLMMQMVEAGGISALTDGVREADENNSRGYYEFEPVKKLRADASWVPQAEGKVVKVIAQLLQHLPQGHDYRVVFMDRDLTEVLRSQTTMLKNLGQKTPALPAAILARTFDQQVAKTKAWAAAQPNV